MVSVGSNVTASDINTIITKINNEENSRGVGLSDLGSVSQYAKVLGQKFKDMVSRNNSINAHHCYCESDGARDPGDTTKTGTTLTLTASSGDYDAGDKITAGNINEIDSDIDSLVAQCDCNTYSQDICSCDSYSCGCQSDCTCVGNCSCEGNCTCNYDCQCNGVCQCDTWRCNIYCVDVQYYCVCESRCQCETNQVLCSCFYDCGNNCSCNSYSCGCQSDCDCDKVCTCEYD